MTLADDFDNSAQLVGCSHGITLFDGDKIWSYIEAYPGSTSQMDIGYVSPSDGVFTHAFEISTVVVQDTFGFNMVADDTTVYMPAYHYTSGAALLAWNKATLSYGRINLAGSSSTPLAVASDGTYVYAITDETTSGNPALFKCTVGGVTEIMTNGTLGGEPTDIIWAGGYLWITIQVGGAYHIKKVATNPLSVVQTINLGDYTPSGIYVVPGSLVADDKNLYLSNYNAVEL
jgi:hypothetical protein